MVLYNLRLPVIFPSLGSVVFVQRQLYQKMGMDGSLVFSTISLN